MKYSYTADENRIRAAIQAMPGNEVVKVRGSLVGFDGRWTAPSLLPYERIADYLEALGVYVRGLEESKRELEELKATIRKLHGLVEARPNTVGATETAPGAEA